MLSIIISSHNDDYFDRLKQNILKTCGVLHEVIRIYNPGRYSICEAYNIGGDKASYPYLLFCHEDIEFLTFNWGMNLIDRLKDKECGIIGVGGSAYYPNVPIGWWELDPIINLQQVENGRNVKYQIEQYEPVQVLDGVLLGMRCDIYQEFKFNEDLKDFHGYDIDISWRTSFNFTNYVSNDILIHHFSNGKPDKVWFETMLQFAKNKRNTNNYRKKFSEQKLEGSATYLFYRNVKKFVPIKRDQYRVFFEFFSLKNLGLIGFLFFLGHYTRYKFKAIS